MYYFQCTCIVLTACVGEATAFDAKEATDRLSTLSWLRNHWLSPNERIDGSDTFGVVNSLNVSRNELSVVPYSNYNYQKMNTPIDWFNNLFTWWNKTLVIGMISSFRQHANILFLFLMSRHEYFNIAYLLNYIYVHYYQMYAYVDIFTG